MLKAGAMSAAQVGDTRSQRMVGLAGPQKKKIANLGNHHFSCFSHFWCYPLVCYIFLLEGISERSNRFQNLQVQQQQQVVNAMLQQLPQQQRSQIEQVPQMGVTTSEMKQ